MSRSKRDILDTEAMLARLTSLLTAHEPAPLEGIVVGYDFGKTRRDAESLRRISMTLHNWHELECGNSSDRVSWVIVRGTKRWEPGAKVGCSVAKFDHSDDGKPYIERHSERGTTWSPIPDREAGALKRLKSIMTRYPTLQSYVQTDPRGCALYILGPGDVPEGCQADSYYSRGLAVFK